MIRYNEMPALGDFEKQVQDTIAEFSSLVGKFVYDIEEVGYRLVIAVCTNSYLADLDSAKYQNSYRRPVVFVGDLDQFEFDLDELAYHRTDVGLLDETYDQYDPADFNLEFRTITHGDIQDCERPPAPDGPIPKIVPDALVQKRQRRGISSFAVGVKAFYVLLADKRMSDPGNYIIGELRIELSMGLCTEESLRAKLLSAFEFYGEDIITSVLTTDFAVSVGCSSKDGCDRKSYLAAMVNNIISHCRSLM